MSVIKGGGFSYSSSQTNALGAFCTQGHKFNIKIFIEGRLNELNKFREWFRKLLIGTGIFVASVLPLGSRADVVYQSRNSQLEDYKLYLIENKEGIEDFGKSASKNLHVLNCSMEELQSNTQMQEELRKDIVDYCNHLFKDFEELKNNYPDNWDDEGAIAITQSVSDNYKAVLREGSSLIFGKWWLAPMTNGTVLLTSNNDISNIQIGKSTISYFIEYPDGDFEEESSIAFSVDKVVEILKKVNVYD